MFASVKNDKCDAYDIPLQATYTKSILVHKFQTDGKRNPTHNVFELSWKVSNK